MSRGEAIRFTRVYVTTRCTRRSWIRRWAPRVTTSVDRRVLNFAFNRRLEIEIRRIRRFPSLFTLCDYFTTDFHLIMVTRSQRSCLNTHTHPEIC